MFGPMTFTIAVTVENSSSMLYGARLIYHMKSDMVDISNYALCEDIARASSISLLKLLSEYCSVPFLKGRFDVTVLL